MLQIIMEDLPRGEVAALYQEGEDAVILVSRHWPDDIRCNAVNDLMATLRTHAPERAADVRYLFAV